MLGWFIVWGPIWFVLIVMGILLCFRCWPIGVGMLLIGLLLLCGDCQNPWGAEAQKYHDIATGAKSDEWRRDRDPGWVGTDEAYRIAPERQRESARRAAAREIRWENKLKEQENKLKEQEYKCDNPECGCHAWTDGLWGSWHKKP